MNLGRRVERAALVRVAQASMLLLDAMENYKPDSVAVEIGRRHLIRRIEEANAVMLEDPTPDQGKEQ